MLEVLAPVARLVGVSTGELNLVTLLILSTPLALVFPRLPSSTSSPAVHLYALVPSIVFLWGVLGLGAGLLHLLAGSLGTYAVAVLGVKYKAGRKMPWLVFALVMGHLGYTHVQRLRLPPDAAEISGPQMVLTMKLISFAWSVYDGTKPVASLDSTQRTTALPKIPGLLAFLGYCFFFPSIIGGPAFTYASYERWTSHALYGVEKTHAKHGSQKDPLGLPAGRRTKCARRFATALVYLGVYAVFGGQFAYSRMLEKSFLTRPLWMRIVFMNVTGFVARTKYYAAWCMAESACIISGLAFNPSTGKYDASRNVRIRSIEFAPNFKILLDSWNINTNVWLRECIYKRVARKGKKPGFKSTQITFITSALWHGTNPCYLMTFVLGGFFQSLNRALRKQIRPFFLPPGALSVPTASAPGTPKPGTSGTATPVPEPLPPAAERTKVREPPQTAIKWAYDIAGIICTQLALNFTVAPFLLLEVRSSLQAWRSVYFYGLFLAFVPLTVLHFLRPTLKRQLAIRDAGAKGTEPEDERKAREAWERALEDKRRRRGLGVPSIGVGEHGVEDALSMALQEAKTEMERNEILKELQGQTKKTE